MGRIVIFILWLLCTIFIVQSSIPLKQIPMLLFPNKHLRHYQAVTYTGTLIYDLDDKPICIHTKLNYESPIPVYKHNSIQKYTDCTHNKLIHTISKHCNKTVKFDEFFNVKLGSEGVGCSFIKKMPPSITLKESFKITWQYNSVDMFTTMYPRSSLQNVQLPCEFLLKITHSHDYLLISQDLNKDCSSLKPFVCTETFKLNLPDGIFKIRIE